MTTEFTKILTEIQEMHDRKQADYGKEGDPFSNVRASEDFGIKPWVGTMARGNDKMKRLQKAARGGTMTNESIEDSLLDLAVYTIIALVLYREGQNGSTGLQKGTLTVDTGPDSYFTTGKGCCGPFVDRIAAYPRGADVGSSETYADRFQSSAGFKSPSPSESKRISDIIAGKTYSARRALFAGVPDVAGMDISK